MSTQSLSPEDLAMLQSILGGGAQSGQLDPKADELSAMVEQLRGGSEQPGLMDAGSFKVAPSPLANVAATASGIMGGMGQGQIAGIRGEQAGIRADQNSRVLDALMKQQQGGQPGMPGIMGNDPNDPYARFRLGGGA